MDVASVLSSVHRDRLLLVIDGGDLAVPAWADWLIWLGQWMRCQTAMDGRRIAVVRLPTRRLSAAFVSLGALFAASRLHDDSLDWDALQALPRGTKVHWRERVGTRSKAYTGRTDSPREIAGSVFLAISIDATGRNHGSTFLLPKQTALSYGVTLGAVTARAEERLSAAANLIRSVVDQASLTWIRSPAADSSLLTERTSFVSDLGGVLVRTGTADCVPLLDVLAIADSKLRTHGKLQLVPARAEVFSDSSQGLTILDGAVAAMRLGNSRARSVVLLLEQSEYDEEAVHLIDPFIGQSGEAGIHVPSGGVLPAPPGVQAFVFGLSDGSNAS